MIPIYNNIKNKGRIYSFIILIVIGLNKKDKIKDSKYNINNTLIDEKFVIFLWVVKDLLYPVKK